MLPLIECIWIIGGMFTFGFLFDEMFSKEKWWVKAMLILLWPITLGTTIRDIVNFASDNESDDKDVPNA
jgi:hypothetical protein